MKGRLSEFKLADMYVSPTDSVRVMSLSELQFRRGTSRHVDAARSPAWSPGSEDYLSPRILIVNTGVYVCICSR